MLELPPPQEATAQSAAIASARATLLNCNRRELAVAIERLAIANRNRSARLQTPNGQPIAARMNAAVPDALVATLNPAPWRLAIAGFTLDVLTITFTGVVRGLLDATT